MRFLTGKDRIAYEAAMVGAAEATAQRDAAEREVARLEARVMELQRSWHYERERADRAVDALLESKGFRPVMPDTATGDTEPDPFAEDPEAVRKILAGMGIERKREAA